MSAIFKPKRGTKASLSNNNPVLSAGEIVFELPEGGEGKGSCIIKMGDGSTTYNNLPYAVDTRYSKSVKVVNSNTSASQKFVVASIPLSDSSMIQLIPFTFRIDYIEFDKYVEYNFQWVVDGYTNFGTNTLGGSTTTTMIDGTIYPQEGIYVYNRSQVLYLVIDIPKRSTAYVSFFNIFENIDGNIPTFYENSAVWTPASGDVLGSYNEDGCRFDPEPFPINGSTVNHSAHVINLTAENFLASNANLPTINANSSVMQEGFCLSDNSITKSPYSFATGVKTTSSGRASFAEGEETRAEELSHAEGYYTRASGRASHAEGGNELDYTVVTADGISIGGTFAAGPCSHAEGDLTYARLMAAHAEGSQTQAYDQSSHAEGSNTFAFSSCSHAEGYMSTASGISSHAEGNYTYTVADAAHAEGNSTYVAGNAAHAEGYLTTASENYSHAEGQSTHAFSLCSHAEGYMTLAKADSAHTEGYMTTVSANYSHAEGSRTIASALYSHVEGSQSTSSGSSAHAEGSSTIAKGNNGSHAEGTRSVASGSASHAEGYSTTAAGEYSHAEGYTTRAAEFSSHAEGHYTTASNRAAHAGGHYNAAMTTGGSQSNTVGTAFVIGNGTSNSALSNAFSVQFSGIVKAKSTITGSTTADYAEFFEWEDGNPDKEDRVGKFVTTIGNKIKFVENENDYILGIVSGEPFVLGNGDCDTWNGMYLKDEFNRTILEPAPLIEFNEETGKEEEVLNDDGTPVYSGTRPKLNPNYDPTQPYISRFDRKEWAPVGMLGILSVYDDGTCQVNGFCKCNSNAIATRSDTGYRVIERVSDNIIKVIFR